MEKRWMKVSQRQRISLIADEKHASITFKTLNTLVKEQEGERQDTGENEVQTQR